MAIIVADIAVDHPRSSLVQQLCDLASLDIISKQERDTLRYFITKDAESFHEDGVVARLYPLAMGRQVRVHRFDEADQAYERGEVVIEKAAATPGQLVANRKKQLRKDNPALSEAEAELLAQTQVFREDPALYWAHRHSVAFPGVPYPKPVAKEAPTREDVYEEAEQLMAREVGLTKRAALQRLVLAHQGERAYHEAYRDYHLQEGSFDGATAGETRAPGEKTVYDTMWG
jgi:hypothetical protein